VTGARERGHRAVAKYWRRRFRLIMNSRLYPESFTEDARGRIAVRVRWVVHDNLGEPLSNHYVTHVYTFQGNLIARMDVGG
jgi:hypothetical protein